MSTRTGRMTAHTASQLQAALGWNLGQFTRARAAGVIPEPDMKTPRWSGQLVNELLARRDELLASLPDDASEDELMAALGLDYPAWRRGRDAGVIPGPDRGGAYWTRPLADELVAGAEQIRAKIPPQPLGAARCAELLSALTGLAVQACDVEDLADRGLVDVVGSYKDWPLYDVAHVRVFAGDEAQRAVLTELVTERQAWLGASLTPQDAAERLRWSREELGRVTAERGVTAGRFGRYALVDVDALAGDEDLAEQVRRSRLLGPDQSAEHLEIRRTDFDYVVAAGWVRPAGWAESRIGRQRWVQIPLYRVGDVEDVLNMPGVDWEAVRAAGAHPGTPSPLREFAELPASRAQLLHAFAGELADRNGAPVRAEYDDRRDRWQLSWEPGLLDHDAIAAAIAADPALCPHRRGIDLDPPGTENPR